MPVNLSGNVEFDEVYVKAGHKGNPTAVADVGREGRPDERGVAADHPRLLEPLNTPPAWRLRQADLFGNLCTGERGILLQQGQDTAVVDVQLTVHRNTFNSAYLEFFYSTNRKYAPS